MIRERIKEFLHVWASLVAGLALTVGVIFGALWLGQLVYDYLGGWGVAVYVSVLATGVFAWIVSGSVEEY